MKQITFLLNMFSKVMRRIFLKRAIPKGFSMPWQTGSTALKKMRGNPLKKRPDLFFNFSFGLSI